MSALAERPISLSVSKTLIILNKNKIDALIPMPVLFYVVGYIIIASSNSVHALAGGIIIYAMYVHYLLISIRILRFVGQRIYWPAAPHTDHYRRYNYPQMARSRIRLISMPYIINAFVGSNISSNVLEGAGWRWGCTSSVHISSSCLTHIISDGMFAILVPVSLAPLIITLLWAERKARKMNIVSTTTDAPKLSFFARTILVAEQLDVLGLLLIGTSVALILLPLTLTNSAKGGWKNGACYH